jgi:hypothetical protein
LIRTSFRIAREVSREHGPFTLELGGIKSTVTLTYTDDRKVAPAGRAVGAGASVVVDHVPQVERRRSDGSFADASIAAEAIENAVRVANRVVHLLAFAGGSRTNLPSLSRFDLENLKCEDLQASTPRDVAVGELLTERRILLREPPLAEQGEVQKRLDPHPSTFAESESLWHDGVQGFYNGRLREALVLLRASIEVAWNAGVTAAGDSYRTCPLGPLPVGLVDSFVERATDWRTALPIRLDVSSKVILGFSFKTDWEIAPKTMKWDKLNTFFQQRHDVAHGTGQPTTSDAWDAMSLTREVLDTLERLTDAVVQRCAAATPTTTKAPAGRP